MFRLEPNTASLDFSIDTAFCLAAHSCLAYETNKEKLQVCLNFYGFKHDSEFDFFDNKDSETCQDTQVYVASTDDVVVISFRGSEMNIDDWFGTNTKFTAKQIPWLTHVSFAKAHEGFILALTNKGKSKTTILEDVTKSLKERHLGDGTKLVFITGHSLGGALATLMALNLRGILVEPSSSGKNVEVRMSCPLAVYTFGSPRVMADTLARAYDAELKRTTFRIVHENDICSQVPFYRWGYTHVGTYTRLFSSGKISQDPIYSERSLGGKGWGDLQKVSDYVKILVETAKGGIEDHAIGKGPLGRNGPFPGWIGLFLSNGGYLGALASAISQRLAETGRL